MQHHLQDIALVVYAYRMNEDREDYFSPNVWNLEGGIYRSLLTCPGTGKPAPPSSPEQSDYIYIDWSLYFKDARKIPDDYPLAYDRRLSNHSGKGINIVFIGNPKHVMWDKNAQWLKQFTKEHPNYKIPIPE